MTTPIVEPRGDQKMKYLRRIGHYGWRWFWTPFTYRFGHGGWVCLDARWLWRFRNGA